MQISTIAAMAALALPLISAQLSSIPQCAQNVTESAITAAGCTDANVHCFCTPAFMGSLQSQIARTCSVSDQQLTLGFTQNMCKSIGINFDLPSEMSVSVATSTATAPTTKSLGPNSSAGTTSVVDTTATVETSWGWSSTPTPAPKPLPPPPPSAYPPSNSTSKSTNSTSSSNSTLHSNNNTILPPSSSATFTGGAGGFRAAMQWVVTGVVVGGLGWGVVL